ncbi:nucleoside hydrolase [Alteribacter populi]|uniref:nucleoside hydrolase n=1 Tax=Alteribacter populi TaxID=2011011 RepID=UPI000BBB3260|nr:nucleoside hydrolase [Alteribacter populi]
MKNVLLFTDPGIDDAFAILYCALHPDIKLVGVVACYGNVELEVATRNVHYILSLLDLEVPVFTGAHQPLSQVETEFFQHIHGVAGLGHKEPEKEMEDMLTNFSDLFQKIAEYDDLIIIEIGRLTSLAMAYMLGKRSMSNVKEIYVMGGAFHVPGNVTPIAEANFHGDPIAANVILHNLPIKLFPLNVTSDAVITEDMVDYILAHSPIEQIKPLIKSMYTFYYDFYKEIDPLASGPSIHDLIPVMCLTSPNIVDFVSRQVTVEISTGPGRGVSIADFRPRNEEQERESGDEIFHEIAVDLDYREFFYLFLETMVLGEGR